MHDMIREQFYHDAAFYQRLTIIMTKANKDLNDKLNYLKKKTYHLKTSNIGEKEYRMKEKALQLAEVEEINEIKEEIFKKLSSLKINGFKSKEEVLLERTAALGTHYDPLKKYELEERSYLVYKKNQMLLLELLLKADYTAQPTQKPVNRLERPASENVRKGPYIPSLTRREKKPIIIKLSKYLKDDLANFSREDKVSSEVSYQEALRIADFHRVSPAEINKINAARSDKSYYDEKEIEDKYQATKVFLTDLRANSDFVVEHMADEQLGRLVDAVSFSLNGVHYYQKMKKTKAMIHPIDILYILSKFK